MFVCIVLLSQMLYVKSLCVFRVVNGTRNKWLRHKLCIIDIFVDHRQNYFFSSQNITHYTLHITHYTLHITHYRKFHIHNHVSTT